MLMSLNEVRISEPGIPFVVRMLEVVPTGTQEHMKDLKYLSDQAREVINNNNLPQPLGLSSNMHKLALQAFVAERIARDQVQLIKDDKERGLLKKAFMGYFGITEDFGLKMERMSDAGQLLARFGRSLGSSSDEEGRKISNISHAVDNLFLQVKVGMGRQLGPETHIWQDLLDSWGDAWSPRIQGTDA